MTRSISALSLGALMLGCGTTAPAPARPVEAPLAGPLAIAAQARPPGVVRIDGVCVEGGDERCEGVDGDCDGHIDEGCPSVAPAPIEIALAWSGPADVELEVRSPAGAPAIAAPISGCASADGPRIERARIERPVAGAYAITARRLDPCGVDAPVAVSLSAVVAGEDLGTWNGTLDASAPLELVAFELR